MDRPPPRGRPAPASATIALAGALLTAPRADGACGQHITLLGVSAGDPPIAWITEDIGGDCGFSFLIQLAIEPDTVRAAVTRMERYAHWEWLSRGFALMPAYLSPDTTSNSVAGRSQGGTPRDAPLPEVLAPPVSEEAHRRFLAHLGTGGSDAVSWNAEHGPGGVSPPHIDGREAEVLYAYPHGLYMNYEIRDVKRLPGALLLLLTDQPALGALRNTMHGFLVVRPAGAAGSRP